MVLGLTKALATQGIEVTILTTAANGDRGQPALDVPLGEPVFQDGYRIFYFSCAPFRRYKFSVDLLRWLAAHADEFDLAHIHALFSPVSTAAATIARFKKLPYVMRPLGTLDPADLQKKRWLKQLYGTLLERPNLNHAAAVHFTSVQEAKTSERFGAMTHDWVIPLGVDLPPALPPATQTATPHILFLSRIDRKKGLELLLPALTQLATEGVSFHLTIAGTNPQDPDYEKSILDRFQTAPLASPVTLSGFVSGAAKWALLRSADLFVLPSYYENFGIAVAEAMAAGVPVVISDRVHIWQEIQQTESGWIAACDVDSLTHQIRSALQDANERKRRGQNAQTYAETAYNWGKISDRLIEAYKEVSKA